MLLSGVFLSSALFLSALVFFPPFFFTPFHGWPITNGEHLIGPIVPIGSFDRPRFHLFDRRLDRSNGLNRLNRMDRLNRFDRFDRFDRFYLRLDCLCDRLGRRLGLRLDRWLDRLNRLDRMDQLNWLGRSDLFIGSPGTLRMWKRSIFLTLWTKTRTAFWLKTRFER